MTQSLFPLKLSHNSSGFITVLIGYTSTVGIVFQAANAIDADQAIERALLSWRDKD